MVMLPLNPQRLSARDGNGGNENGSWGTPQIATPAIVGGALIVIFAIYIIWQRRTTPERSYSYQPVRPDWARIFVPRRRPQRVRHRSTPITIDESMRSSGFTFDFRRSRPARSDSSESQAPLTAPSDTFDFTPTKPRPDSHPPVPKRRGVRWWWFFGSRPREVKSEEPGLWWRIDGSDGSSHGHSSHGHEENNVRLVGTLEAVHEDQEEDADSVIRIGDNFASVESTPLAQHFPEQVRVMRGMSPVPEHPVSSGSRTPQPVASVARSGPGTPVMPTPRGLPPSYEASHSHTQYTSTEDVARSARSQPYTVIPAPVRTAAYSSPRLFHGRDLSSDSVLAAQPPMVASSLY